MKKLLIAVIVLMIVVALVGPKFAGNIFNQGLDNYISSVNKTGIYQATINNRKQGWFVTAADIQVVLNIPSAPGKAAVTEWEINLQVDAQHGPLLIKSGFGLGWLDWAVTLVVDTPPPSLTLEEDMPIYQALGKMNLFGGTSFKDTVAAMTYTDTEMGVTAAINGWQGKGYLSESSVEYSGGPGNLSMSLPNVYNLELNDLEISVNAQTSVVDLLKGNFYDGKSLISFKQVTVNNLIDDTNTQLDNFLLESIVRFDEETDLADLRLEMILTNVSTAEFILTDLFAAFEVNNIQQVFFKAYQQMNKDILQSPHRVNEIMQQAMQSHLLAQLQAEPEINVTALRGILNDGNVDMISINKLTGVASLPDTMENNDFWLQHMRSTTEISVDESAAIFIASQVVNAQLVSNPRIAEMEPSQREKIIKQQSEATLNSLVQQGLFIKTESGYNLSFILQDGKASLNKNVIPLAM